MSAASKPGTSSLGPSWNPMPSSSTSRVPSSTKEVKKVVAMKRPAALLAKPAAAIAAPKPNLPGGAKATNVRLQSVLATPGIGRLARDGQVTACEKLSINHQSEPTYQKFWKKILEWAQDENEIVDKSSIHHLCLDFADKLLLEEKPAHILEKTLAAIVHYMPDVSLDDLPRTKKTKRGFLKAYPKLSRPPIPDEMCAGICAVFQWERDCTMARMTLFGQRCQLRPGERLKVQNGDFFPPSSANGCEHWSVQLAPRERMDPSKTLTFDDSVIIDYPPWLGQLLGPVAQAGDPSEQFFQITAKETVEKWQRVLSAMGVPDAVQYQLRHGGASTDLAAKRRSESELLARMRISSVQTLKRYAKPALLNKMMQKLSPVWKAFCIQAHENLEGIMFQNVRLQPPSA